MPRVRVRSSGFPSRGAVAPAPASSGRPHEYRACQISPSAPIRSTSSRSCARSAGAFATNAELTTPRSRSASSPPRSSNAFSTRPACARICSSSSARARACRPGFLYQFEDTTLFDSDKPIVRFFRRLLHPFLKLLFNPNVLSTTLHKQAAFNQYVHAHQPLQFELLHNLVLELTRASIEVKNLKMRLESVQSRLEFNERRARALEAVVQYKPEAPVRGGTGRQPPRSAAAFEHARGQGAQGRSTGAPTRRALPQPLPPARAPQRTAIAAGRRGRGGGRGTGCARDGAAGRRSIRSRAATACGRAAGGAVAAAAVSASRAGVTPRVLSTPRATAAAVGMPTAATWHARGTCRRSR